MKIRRIKYLVPIAYAILVLTIVSGGFGIYLNDALIGLLIVSLVLPIYWIIPHYKTNKSVYDDSFHSEKMIINIKIDGVEHRIAINEIDFSNNEDVKIHGVLLNNSNE